MSKKKVNQRAVREISKNIKQTPVYRVQDNAKNPGQPSQNNIDPRVIKDLKKVGIVIGLMLLSLGVLSYLAYKTDVFKQALEKVHISY